MTTIWQRPQTLIRMEALHSHAPRASRTSMVSLPRLCLPPPS